MGSSICLVLALRGFVEVSALRRWGGFEVSCIKKVHEWVFKILGRMLLVGRSMGGVYLNVVIEERLRNQDVEEA